MTDFVIGVDGGGSKTEAVILDMEGRVLGRGRSGSSNYHLVGPEAAQQALLQGMESAAQVAGVSHASAKAVVWALAGAGRPTDAELLHKLQALLMPGIPGRVVTDAAAALVAGGGAGFGIVVISGTGMIVYGEHGPDRRARAGGWGHLLDQGSGYALAMDALRAIVRREDGWEIPTRLTTSLLNALDMSAPQQLVSWLYASSPKPSEIARLAPLVLKEAESGDLVAIDVAMRAADALAGSVEAVTRRLELFDTDGFPLVLTGGLLNNHVFYRDLVAQAIRTRVPAARPRMLRVDAATGAGLMALTLAGHPVPSFDEPSGENEDIWASEQRNVLTMDLDTRPTLEVVGLMHLEDRRAVASIRPILSEIARIVDAIADRMKKGGRLIYAGAGTSGRLGVLDASECPPTFNTRPGQVIGVIAGGRRALTDAVEEAEDHAGDGAQAMRELDVGPLDSVIGIAASGRTPFVRGALEEARTRGALTAALICNLPAPLAELADYVLAPLVGPEAITGSTRLKAGTVQKLVLNMISTGVMVRLGKTYGNLMVDVQQNNAKLQQRARRIVAQACHISEEDAARALARSDQNVKVAIVSTLLHCSPSEARERLKRSGGSVGKAIGNESAAGL